MTSYIRRFWTNTGIPEKELIWSCILRLTTLSIDNEQCSWYLVIYFQHYLQHFQIVAETWERSHVVVFTPQARDSDEETLISESNSEGKKFSNMFREKHGEDCNQFMDSSLMDAVTTHVFYDKIGNNCSNWAETDSRLYVISSSWKWRSFSKVVICTRYWWIGCFHLLLLWNTWKRIVFVGVVMSLQSMVIR